MSKELEDLKATMIEKPIFHPDFTNTFKVHTFAFEICHWGVIMQDRHPITFESVS